MLPRAPPNNAGYCWQLAIVLCVVIPLLVVTVGVLIKHLQRSSAASQAAYTRAGAIAQEVLGAIRTVASLGGEKREMARYDAQVKEAERAGISAAWGKGVMGSVTGIVMYSTYALGLWYGSKLISDTMDSDVECQCFRPQ